MVRRIQSKFVLEVFDGKLSNPKHLAGYLKIYLENIAPENRTDTNELISFLENPLKDRRIIYFGLSYDGTPCGFASFMFYPAEAVAIADHVAIDTRVRGVGAFFAFVDMIADYLNEVGIIPDYVVAEIMRRTQSLQGDVNPAQLVRLLRLIGFRVLQIPYVAPHSGITDHPERYKSALMVIPRQPISDIPADECKKLIELIYYGHYLKWYARVWSSAETAAYKGALDKSFASVIQRITNSAFVKLNGAMVTTDDLFQGSATRVHAQNYSYIALILIPAVVTIVVAFTQAREVTIATAIITLTCLLVLFFSPTWREKVMRFFRLV